jgi:HAD superfamily phosphoserine phosphatase-like hydrolase
MTPLTVPPRWQWPAAADLGPVDARGPTGPRGSAAADPATRGRRSAPVDPYRLRRDHLVDRHHGAAPRAVRVRTWSGRTPRRAMTPAAWVSRRLMSWEVSLIDADPDALRSFAASQPHDPGFVPFIHRAQAAGIPVEIVSDGYGFFIQPALAALGVGDCRVVTARTTFEVGGRSIEFVNGHPTCLVCGTCKRQRVLAHRASGRRVVYIGDGESDRIRRRLQRRRLREAVAGADLPRGGLGVPPMDGVQGDRRVAGGDAGRLGRGSTHARAGPGRRRASSRLLLRARGLGEGTGGSATRGRGRRSAGSRSSTRPPLEHHVLRPTPEPAPFAVRTAPMFHPAAERRSAERSAVGRHM